MKKLYIDVDGVLLTAKETRAANFVLPFIDYITNNFECFWLTTHCKGETKHVLDHLSKYLDKNAIKKLETIQPTSWSTSKTEAIDFSANFYWLDDNPMEFERNIMIAKSLIGRLIIVDLTRQNELWNIMEILKSEIGSS